MKMQKKYLIPIMLILLSHRICAQDTLIVSMDNVQLPVLSELHYVEITSIEDRGYNYDVYNRARFYKSMGYTVMTVCPVVITVACMFSAYAIGEAFELPVWAQATIPIFSIAVAAGISVPIIFVGINMVRKGNMIEQTAYMPITDKVSLSTSRYANLNNRMDQGATFGLAVKL